MCRCVVPTRLAPPPGDTSLNLGLDEETGAAATAAAAAAAAVNGAAAMGARHVPHAGLERVAPGHVIVAVDGESVLRGHELSYRDVLTRINHAPRPVAIRFRALPLPAPAQAAVGDVCAGAMKSAAERATCKAAAVVLDGLHLQLVLYNLVMFAMPCVKYGKGSPAGADAAKKAN